MLLMTANFGHAGGIRRIKVGLEYSDRGEIVERKLWISRCRWRKVQGVVTGLLSWAEARRLKMRFVGLRNVDVNYWDLDNASSVGVLDYGG